ncbi:long-chain-fatty-acid--CoA ligase [Photobacterium damselae subsp. piscicida]|nr:long-chain-fatty-acid--CoA ligase [Photobacterium damselae subsp. piscicida]
MVNKVANHLTKIGIKPDDKIALSCPNIPAFVVNYYAIQKVGAVAVPLNIQLKGTEVAYHLSDSDAVAFICFQGNDALPTGEYGYEGFEQTSTCQHFILIDSDNTVCEESDAVHSYNQWLSSDNGCFDAVYRKAEDTCVILYTSGTTGHAKGAELSQSNMLCNAQACQSERH